jgi:hypothetical protein
MPAHSVVDARTACRAPPRIWVGLTAGLTVATFLLTRQTQVPALEGLAAPWALLLVLWCLRWNPTLLILVPLLAYALASALTSIALGREPGAVMRFFAITLGTLVAFHVRPRNISVPWVLLPVALQALAIGGIAIALGALQDPALAVAARDMALEANWGDIYSFDGLYYRVQLIGNALLPLLFMIAVWRWHVRRLYRVLTLVALLGLAAAGNLTYFAVAAIAVLMSQGHRLRRHALAPVALAVALPLALIVSWSAINEVISQKFEGSDSSMAVRFDQIDVVQSALGDSPAKLLFGSGLGAAFPDGRQRDYSQDRYIELQSLYLLLQLGVVGTLIYLSSLWLSARQRLDPAGRRIFWLYMLSGLTNPYILDANQIVATVILVCAFPRQADQ